jgi:two-component system, OmpR family, sensor histidine kinase QseC
MKRRLPVKNGSLTLKLLIGTLSLLCVYVAVIGILAYRSAKESIAEAHDQALVVNVNGLVFIIQEEAKAGGFDRPLDFSITPDTLRGDDKAVFAKAAEYRMLRVWFYSELVLNSNTDTPKSVPPFPEGFSDQVLDGDTWRIYSLHIPAKHLIVELGEQVTARQMLVWSIAEALIYPFLISLPIVGFFLWRVIHAAMGDLHRVTRQVNSRTPELMAPLRTSRLPPDLLPLVEAINALLARLGESLSRERQITQLAAHELRTPLTAIKLQAQMGLRASTEESRVHAFKGLLDGVERASHLVEQLLTLTRVEQSQFDLYDVDAHEAAERVRLEMAPLSERRGQRIELSLQEPFIVRANDDLLIVTLRNLVGNAVKYAPEKSKILIESKRRDGRIDLDVIDQGPGIPEAVREKIFERFFRFHTGKVLGSGLGLTIARQCAELMNASLSVHTPEGGKGLCVRLSFPAAPEAH